MVHRCLSSTTRGEIVCINKNRPSVYLTISSHYPIAIEGLLIDGEPGLQRLGPQVKFAKSAGVKEFLYSFPGGQSAAPVLFLYLFWAATQAEFCSLVLYFTNSV